MTETKYRVISGSPINVKDFGATGDGTTDDTAAIQAAIDAAGEFAEVRFAPGTYKVSSALTITSKDNLTLNGNGCKITQNTTLTKTFHLSNVYNVEVFGFELRGKGDETIDTSTSFNGVAGIYIADSINVRVHHNFLTNHAGGGIRWMTTGEAETVCQDINISNNTVRGKGTPYISALDNTFDAAIGSVDTYDYLDITIKDNDVSDHCFGIFAAANLAGSYHISDNYVHDIPGQHGIYCNPTNNTDISGNTVRNCAATGIKVQIRDNALFDGETIENCVVKGNTVINADVHGVEIIGDEGDNRTFGKTCVVRNNVILELEEAGSRGISLTQFQGVCEGNTVSDVKGYGIYGDSVSGQISHNSIEDVDYNGLQLSPIASEVLHVCGNMLIDCVLNSGGLDGSESRTKFYAYVTADYSTPTLYCLYCWGNTFKSEAAESVDYDNALRVDSGVTTYAGPNFNLTGKPYFLNGTNNYVAHGFSETPYQTRTGAGGIDLALGVDTIHIASTGTDALTLLDGADQQKLYLVMTSDGGDATLTPSNLGNGTTITFDDVGDSAHLLFTNDNWYFMGGTATVGA